MVHRRGHVIVSLGVTRIRHVRAELWVLPSVKRVAGGRHGSTGPQGVAPRVVARSLSAGCKILACANRINCRGDAESQLVEDGDILRVLKVLSKVGRRKRALQFLEQFYGAAEGPIIIDQILRPKGVRQDRTATQLDNV